MGRAFGNIGNAYSAMGYYEQVQYKDYSRHGPGIRQHWQCLQCNGLLGAGIQGVQCTGKFKLEKININICVSTDYDYLSLWNKKKNWNWIFCSLRFLLLSWHSINQSLMFGVLVKTAHLVFHKCIPILTFFSRPSSTTSRSWPSARRWMTGAARHQPMATWRWPTRPSTCTI